jgi:lipopolysaccharide biosynthesis glycosyltransferase
LQTPLHIALGCDDTFAPHAGVVIQSVLNSNQDNEDTIFHIVSFSLSDLNRTRLSSIGDTQHSKIIFYSLPSNKLAALPPCHLTLNAYLRLILPELLHQLERVIYLDCDVLVLKSLRPLWEVTFEKDTLVAACEDIYSLYAKLGNHQLLYFFNSLGMKPGEKYFNSGVLLIDLNAWREHDITDKAIQWGITHQKLIRHADQDILNVICKNRVHYLSLEWNLSIHMILRTYHIDTCTVSEREAAISPAVIHYVGERKACSLEHPLPYQKQYIRVVKQTPWRTGFIAPLNFSKQFLRYKRVVKLLLLTAKRNITELLFGFRNYIKI